MGKWGILGFLPQRARRILRSLTTKGHKGGRKGWREGTQRIYAWIASKVEILRFRYATLRMISRIINSREKGRVFLGFPQFVLLINQ